MPEARSVAEFRQILDLYLDESDNPDFITYSRDILDYYEHWVWEIQYLMRLGKFCGKRVLDVGCGFGWHTVGLAALGGNEVVANDIRETMISALEKRLRVVQKEHSLLGVERLLGDICALNMGAESYDGIYCHETIEHVHDLDLMFTKCFEILRRGGRAVFTNDNNALCRSVRKNNEELWKKRDREWSFIERLKQERPVENADVEPYAAMRERMVRSANPRLTDEEVTSLVEASAGMVQHEIETLSKRYGAKTKLPSPPKWSWCRNPETGEYCERLLDPFELARQLEGIGFRVSVHHLFRKWPLCIMNSWNLRPFNLLLFQLRPPFVLVAEKP